MSTGNVCRFVSLGKKVYLPQKSGERMSMHMDEESLESGLHHTFTQILTVPALHLKPVPTRSRRNYGLHCHCQS